MKNCAAADDFVHVFVNNKEKLKSFLEHIVYVSI